MSKTVRLEFEEGQKVMVSYEVKDVSEAINLIVETQAILSGNFVDVEKVGKNQVSFEVNMTQDYYFTFVNSGGDTVVFHYEIAVDGYNNNSGYYYVSVMTLILGVLILFAFYKDAFI